MEELFVRYEDIINTYYENDAKKLHNTVNKVLKNLHFKDVDLEDFYSFATEIFVMEVIPNYNPEKPFEAFLYSTLYKKFCTRMTRETRDKRCTKVEIDKVDEHGNKKKVKEIIPDVRMDAPIKDEDNSTFGDLIADKTDVENEIFGKEDREEWHKEVKQYLSSLSPLQKRIIFMLSDNYTPNEICEDLHIDISHYNHSVNRMFADEKTKILRPLMNHN